MIHGPLVLHGLVLCRLMATHLCSTSTRITFHIIVIIMTPMCYTDYCYTFMFHRYTDIPMHGLPHAILLIVIIVTWILDISLLHMHVWFLYSCHMDPRSYYMYCHVTVFMLYECFLLLIWLFPILDMRAIDMQYVEIPHLLFPFPVILFSLYCSRFPLYCSMLSTELWSSYHVTRIMYYICSCYIVYLTYQIIKLTGVWGRLDG